MTANDWIQLTLYFVVLLALAIPLGRYMAQVMSGDAQLGVQNRAPDRARALPAGRRALDDEMTWPRYAAAHLLFNAAGLLLVYALQRLQAFLPAQSGRVGAVLWHSPSTPR